MKNITAVQLLRDDHKKMKGLFRQAENIENKELLLAEYHSTSQLGQEPGESPRVDVLKELFEEFIIHSQIEERLFYPTIQTLIEEKLHGEQSEAGLVAQFQDDHQEVIRMIQESVFHADFSQMAEIISSVEGHMEAEERDLFPFVEKHFPEKLELLGLQMDAMKTGLKNRNGIPDASSPMHVQNPNGGEQLRRIG